MKTLWSSMAIVMLLLVACSVVDANSNKAEAPKKLSADKKETGEKKKDKKKAEDKAKAVDIEHSMEVLKRNMRILKKAISDDEKVAESLVALAAVQLEALKSTAGIPSRAQSLSGKEKSKFIDNYRLGMIELKKALIKIEEALVKRDLDRARFEFSKLKSLEKKSHDKFQEPGRQW